MLKASSGWAVTLPVGSKEQTVAEPAPALAASDATTASAATVAASAVRLAALFEAPLRMLSPYPLEPPG